MPFKGTAPDGNRGREVKSGTRKLAMCERTSSLIVVNQSLSRWPSEVLGERAGCKSRAASGTVCFALGVQRRQASAALHAVRGCRGHRHALGNLG